MYIYSGRYLATIYNTVLTICITNILLNILLVNYHVIKCIFCVIQFLYTDNNINHTIYLGICIR